MYSFPIVFKKKAQSLQRGQWRAIDNPLHHEDDAFDERDHPPQYYIHRVYPHLYCHLGPIYLRHYRGTLVLVYTPCLFTECVGKPHFLIWIDREHSGDIIFAQELSDLLQLLPSLAVIVLTDMLTEIFLTFWIG